MFPYCIVNGAYMNGAYMNGAYMNGAYVNGTLALAVIIIGCKDKSIAINLCKQVRHTGGVPDSGLDGSYNYRIRCRATIINNW